MSAREERVIMRERVIMSEGWHHKRLSSRLGRKRIAQRKLRLVRERSKQSRTGLGFGQFKQLHRYVDQAEKTRGTKSTGCEISA